MNFREKFSKQKIFQDFITFNNFIGFIVAREYLDNVTKFVNSNEENTYNFYKFLLKLLKGDDTFIIPCLTDSSCMCEVLSHIVLQRIENLRKVDCLVKYTHRSYIKKSLACDADELGDLKSVEFHHDSLVGQFLRKFGVGFHLLSFEQITMFCNSFYAFYDSVRTEKVLPNSTLTGCLSSNQVTVLSEDIITKAGRLGSLSSSEFELLKKNLESYQKNYPDLATSRFASHVIAMRQRNLSQAESNLFKAFEMAISWPSTNTSANAPEPKPVDAWTRMTLGAADMHHTFGHSSQARSFLHQALAQALETNDALSLRHAKAAHEVINPMGEPFRYETSEGHTDGLVSSDLLLTELCCKLLQLLGTGASPQKVLLTYFNSVVAPKSDALAIVLLNLAFIFSVYGYSIMSTTLLQCVIIIDCLCPCSNSDSVLSTSISQLARTFAASGLSAQAILIIKSATETIGQFEELSHFERARVETQLEQALSLGDDFDHCGRLINDLALFCPWEANLRRANMEWKRENQSLAVDILQALSDRSESLRTSIRASDDSDLHSGSLYWGDGGDRDVVGLSKILKPPRTGGVAALVRFEIRTRIAMAEIFAFNAIFTEAINQLELALTLCRQYHFKTFENVCIIMITTISSLAEVPIENSLLDDTSIFEIFADLCHQAEPMSVMLLANMKFWLSHTAGCHNAGDIWKDHLCESANFFAAVGDKCSLQKVVKIFGSLDNLEKHSNSTLSYYFFPIC